MSIIYNKIKAIITETISYLLHLCNITHVLNIQKRHNQTIQPLIK